MLNRDTAQREAARTDGQPASGRGWRRVELVVFSIYAAWCAIAVAEIFGRHMTGASPFPGILANYNGNIAVSGFIAPFGLLAQALAASRWLSPRVARGLGLAIIAVASLAWTVFFVVMEVTDL
jgi:hypothetical protein